MNSVNKEVRIMKFGHIRKYSNYVYVCDGEMKTMTCVKHNTRDQIQYKIIKSITPKGYDWDSRSMNSHWDGNDMVYNVTFFKKEVDVGQQAAGM